MSDASTGRQRPATRRQIHHAARARGRTTRTAFGPGLISGASDNDPTTVATLAVVGSTTTYGLAWLVLLIIPMLVVVQWISAAIGCETRGGLEDVIRRRFGAGWARVALVAVLSVNVLTLAADLEGGCAALGILTHSDYRFWVVPFALAVGAMLVLGSYDTFARVFRIIPLVFFAYVVTAILAHPRWGDVLRASLIPHFEFRTAYTAGAIALLGTTLTAYAYVWESIEVAEERAPLRSIGLVQVDAGLGMIVAGASFWFIAVGTGATLGVHHHAVQTAQDAATALVPVAGPYASALFAAGLLGSALLAVPVLAGTSAYVAAETFGWKEGLDRTFASAPRFYWVLVGTLAVGGTIALAGVPPIRLLLWSSIAGGIATPVTLAMMMLVARDARVMHRSRIGAGLAAAGWTVTGVVTAAVVVYFAQLVTGSG